MIHGIAKVRIPDGYPQTKHLTIVSWGKPTFNHTEEGGLDEDGVEVKSGFVDPNVWMPISEELQLRADHPRFAACREATRRANKQRAIEVNSEQAMLLGPHASLPKLAAKASMPGSKEFGSPTSEGSPAKSPSSDKKKKRQHRIFTSAAGFVRYAG